MSGIKNNIPVNIKILNSGIVFIILALNYQLFNSKNSISERKTKYPEISDLKHLY